MGELGTKYKCFKCETKFYDLGRPLPLCPSCGEDQNNREPKQVLKRRRRRTSLKAEPEIHIVPEEHDPLAEHEEHDPEEHEAPDIDEEQAEEHDDDDAPDKAEKDHDDDKEDGDEFDRD